MKWMHHARDPASRALSNFIPADRAILPLIGLVLVLFNGQDDRSYAAFDLAGYQSNSDRLFLTWQPGGAGGRSDHPPMPLFKAVLMLSPYSRARGRFSHRDGRHHHQFDRCPRIWNRRAMMILASYLCSNLVKHKINEGRPVIGHISFQPALSLMAAESHGERRIISRRCQLPKQPTIVRHSIWPRRYQILILPAMRLMSP